MNKYCMIEMAFGNIEEVNKGIDILLSKKLRQVPILSKLTVVGTVSHEEALKKAHEEYDKYMRTHLTQAEKRLSSNNG